MIEALTYDDVLLLPHYSDIRSRSEVDISTDQKNKPSWLVTQESTEQRTLALPLVLVMICYTEFANALRQEQPLFVLMWRMGTIS